MRMTVSRRRYGNSFCGRPAHDPRDRSPALLPAGRRRIRNGGGLGRVDRRARMTPRVREILSWYGADSAGTLTNLARMLNHGRLAGTGKLVILPVDQGFEHGPARSFAPNPAGYDPHYHFQLAIDAGLSAYAAPLGMLEAGAGTFAGQIPLIIKLNSANSLSRLKEDADQAVTGSVADALRLGCSAIGFTIYPGSDAAYDQFEEFRELSEEAKAAGLAV